MSFFSFSFELLNPFANLHRTEVGVVTNVIQGNRYVRNAALIFAIVTYVSIIVLPVYSSSEVIEERFLNQVVVVGIFGFIGGSEGGVGDIIRTIREELVKYGVPERNIGTRSWNDKGFQNPTEGPNIEDLSTWVIERGTENPSYYVIIGHSFGGWAAARLSDHNPPRTPDMLFTIDAILGPNNNKSVNPKAKTHRINWRQNISAFQIATDAQCLGGDKGICKWTWKGIDLDLCGAKMPNMENYWHNFVKKSDCKSREICAKPITKKWRTAHTKIDEDACIRATIKDYVVAGFKQKLEEARNFKPKLEVGDWLPAILNLVLGE